LDNAVSVSDFAF